MTLSPYWLLLLTLLLPLPYSTDRRGRRTPWVTYILIAVNVVVFCFTGPQTYARWGLVPNHPHFIALLTGIFIHVSLMHLLGNMVFLWLFGPHVEEALGWEAFLALYLGGGIAAGLLHMAIVLLFAPKVVVPLVGSVGGDLGNSGPVRDSVPPGADLFVLAAGRAVEVRVGQAASAGGGRAGAVDRPERRQRHLLSH